MRKHYLDNIRWATVIIVMIYHVCYLFNGVGIPGAIRDAKSIPLFDSLACIIYPWFMVLLFIIAGISSRYALQKRSDKQFIRERAVKLLVPSTLGLLVIHWITGYFNIKLGGGLDTIPKALLYPISVVSGTGPLWFIQMLFLFSCLLVLLRKIDQNDRLWMLCGKAKLPVIFLLVLLIYASAQVLNLPVLTTYRFGIYFVSFLIGYYVFSHDEVQNAIEKICLPMLGLALASAVFYAFYYAGQDFASPDCLQSVITNLYLWTVVLAVLGCGKRFFDFETPFTRYMTKSSFGVYVLHYLILLSICNVLHFYLDLPVICNYLIALILEIVLTFAANEVVRRIPVIRYCVLGIKTK